MKLHDLKKKVLNNKKLNEASCKLNEDIAFQMSSRIEMLRLSLGLTQEQFAKKIGVQQPAVARMERGIVVPTLPVLQKIARAFRLRLVLPDFVPTTMSSCVPIKSPLNNICRNRIAG